jgi:nondiscriminating aspartyl-tRNA synthetase
MERTLIKQASQNIGKEVLIKGRVVNLRKLGAVVFASVQDYSGAVQTVWEGDFGAKMGDAVEIVGGARQDERAKGGVEILGKEMKVVAGAIEEYPFDLSKPVLNLQLPTLLDSRALSLRHQKVQAIFRLYDLALESYGQIMRQEGFIEIKTPKILEAASEGGANFFKIKYFNKNAYLAQSPQLYKQIMVGAFERVFEIGSTFRAEPHFTTRHINEYISLDAEMGFIDSFYDVMDMLNKILGKMVGRINEKGGEYLKAHNANLPPVPEKIPHIKLAELKEAIKKKYKYEVPQTTDLDPEGERLAGRWAQEECSSEWLFVTHYPMAFRPFYTLSDKDNPEESDSFDLLFRGVELATGSQRIHLYKDLVASMKKKKVKQDGLEFYLDVFKFAMPPHGGWGLGSERFVQQILGLSSVKEATLFPRDVKRLSP